MKTEKKYLTLWKENKIDKEYKMELNELADLFLNSSYSNIEYIRYYGLEKAILFFITSKDGLNSFCYGTDFLIISKELRELILQKKDLTY